MILYVGMAPTRPFSLNKSNGSELPNADVMINPFQMNSLLYEYFYTL